MGTGLAAEDAVLVLHADDVDRVDVQKIGGAAVRGEVGLVDLETHPIRIGVAASDVVHRDDEAIEIGTRLADGVSEVGRERGDAALPRRVVAEQGDLPDGVERDQVGA